MRVSPPCVMSLLVWKIVGFGSNARKSELKSLLKEKRIEIFELQEGKLKAGLNSLVDVMSKEWQLASNLNSMDENKRSSILVGCKNSQWKITSLFSHA